mgnify:CR=1 FL=1
MDLPVPVQSEDARWVRIRTLSNELDAQRQFALDRGKTRVIGQKEWMGGRFCGVIPR